MPNPTVPANATTLPVETLPRVFPCFGCQPSRRAQAEPCDLGGAVSESPIFRQLAENIAANPFLDFDADDSGAMAHAIPQDAYEQFLTAFKAITAGPWPRISFQILETSQASYGAQLIGS